MKVLCITHLEYYLLRLNYRRSMTKMHGDLLALLVWMLSISDKNVVGCADSELIGQALKLKKTQIQTKRQNQIGL